MKVDPMLLKRIHESINTGATGNPNQFSEKLGISRRLFLETLKQLKVEFDAPIEYSRPRETYYYTEDCVFYFGIVRSSKAVFTNTLINAINNAAIDIISKSIISLILLESICLL
jgi:hypothetical protein